MEGKAKYCMDAANVVVTALGVAGSYLCFATAFLVQWEAWASVKSQNLESIFDSLRKE